MSSNWLSKVKGALRLVILSPFGALLGYAALIVLLLCYSGGHGLGSNFTAGNLEIDYQFTQTGLLRLESLDYCVILDGRTIGSEKIYQDGQYTFKFRYQDGSLVNFIIKPGQTVWISRKHEIHITPKPLKVQDVLLLEKYKHAPANNVGSLEELCTILQKLKAPPK